MKQHCGSSNIRHINLDENCFIPTQVHWSFQDFVSEFNLWSRRYHKFRRSIWMDRTLTKLPHAVIYYEDLQHNLSAVFSVGNMLFASKNAFLRTFFLIQDMFEKINPQGYNPAIDANAKHFMEYLRSDKIRWSKRSKEDLSLLLSNYDDIRRQLDVVSCGCVLDQLTSPFVKVFESCSKVIDEISGKCQDLT